MNLPALPGLTLSSLARPEPGLNRATEALGASAGGFAEELARRAQGLNRAAAAPAALVTARALPASAPVPAAPPAAPTGARPEGRAGGTSPAPERVTPSAAGAQGASAPGAPAPGPKNTSAAADVPDRPVAQATPPASPSTAASAADSRGAHPADGDANGRGTAAVRSAVGAKPGMDRGTPASGLGSAEDGPDNPADRSPGADQAKPQAGSQGAAPIPLAPEATTMPAHQAPPPDAASLAAWVAGWQAPTGAVDTQDAKDTITTDTQGLADTGTAPASRLAGWGSAWTPARAEARPDAGQRSGDWAAIAARGAIEKTGLDPRDTPSEDVRTQAAGRGDANGSDRLDPALPDGTAATLPTLPGTPAGPVPTASADPATPDAAAAATRASALAAAHGDPGPVRLPPGLSAGGIERRDGLEGVSTARGQGPQTAPLGAVPGRDTPDARTASGAAQLHPGQSPDKLPPFSAGQPSATEALPLGADPASATQAEVRPGSFSQALDIAALAAGQGLGGSAATAAAGRTEAAAVALPTPVTDPAFREALGVQVSVLARDGVQSAELHLNPGDMGPISVRIEIDGQNAQVNFGVDHVQTRAIVEAGLPELASALREAGLTLTGGGVSEHGRPAAGSGDPGGGGGRPQDGPGGRRGGSAEGPADEPAPPPRRVRLPGAVDLYA